MIEDLTWFGITWDEGYNHDLSSSVTDPYHQYIQSKRFPLYAHAWKILYEKGYIYPCKQSRRDVEAALSAPHDNISHKKEPPATSTTKTTDSTQPFPTIERPPEMKKMIEEIANEAIFPPFLRPSFLQDIPFEIGNNHFLPLEYQHLTSPFNLKLNWRFRIPDDYRPIRFIDGNVGEQIFIPGEDFGDFLVWRLDGYPSYELAVVVDDILMRITEVVRGQDLLISTARQLLLMKAIFGLDYEKVEAWNDSFGMMASSYQITLSDEPKEEELIEETEKEDHKTDESGNEDASEESSIANKEVKEDDVKGNDEEGNEKERILNQYFSVQNEYSIPSYYHLPLVCDENGVRLAKRNFAKSLRRLREEDNMTSEEVRDKYFQKKLPI